MWIPNNMPTNVVNLHQEFMISTHRDFIIGQVDWCLIYWYNQSGESWLFKQEEVVYSDDDDDDDDDNCNNYNDNNDDDNDDDDDNSDHGDSWQAHTVTSL